MARVQVARIESGALAGPQSEAAALQKDILVTNELLERMLISLDRFGGLEGTRMHWAELRLSMWT